MPKEQKFDEDVNPGEGAPPAYPFGFMKLPNKDRPSAVCFRLIDKDHRRWEVPIHVIPGGRYGTTKVPCAEDACSGIILDSTGEKLHDCPVEHSFRILVFNRTVGRPEVAELPHYLFETLQKIVSDTTNEGRDVLDYDITVAMASNSRALSRAFSPSKLSEEEALKLTDQWSNIETLALKVTSADTVVKMLVRAGVPAHLEEPFRSGVEKPKFTPKPKPQPEQPKAEEFAGPKEDEDPFKDFSGC